MPFFFWFLKGILVLRTHYKAKSEKMVQRGASVFYSLNVCQYQGALYCTGWAVQHGGKRGSPRLQGFASGRERPQGPESSLTLACRGTEAPRKQGMFQKPHSYRVVIRLICPCNTIPAHLPLGTSIYLGTAGHIDTGPCMPHA